MLDEAVVLDDEQVEALTASELHAYFRPCIDAIDWPDGEYHPTPRQPRFDCPPNHTVYFIGGAGGAIKIGFTQQDLHERVKCIQTGSPVKLVVPATQNAPKVRERHYHQRFAEHRLFGEWFSPAPDILAEIARLNTSTTKEAG